MSKSNNTSVNSIMARKIALNGMMIALVFIATYLTQIPTPVGVFNLGDAVIIITAVFLGRKSGFLAGALGSAIADLAMGLTIFAPVTFFVKGLEGFVIGQIVYIFSQRVKSKRNLIVLAACITGSIIMIVGYFFAELYVLKLFDNTMGLAKALTDLPYNLLQGGACTFIGYSLCIALDRFKITRYIAN